MQLTIRPLTAHDELRACEDIQRQAWNMLDIDIVPMHMLVAFREHGGIVLGGDVDGELAGFLFGYPGLLPPGDPRREAMGTPSFHTSQMAGVVPRHQNSGLGYWLKLAQRALAQKQGLDLMMWTFDPLFSRNAHFNITRLRGVTRTYVRNLYDELPGINGGLPTDRFELEWWLNSEHVAAHVPDVEYPLTTEEGCFTAPAERPDPGALSPEAWQAAGALPANPTTRREDGFRVPPDAVEAPGTAQFLIEIPGDFFAMKAADMGLACAWRLHVREAMEAAFAAGYAVTGFTTEGRGPARRSYYVLTRDVDFAAMAGGQA